MLNIDGKPAGVSIEDWKVRGLLISDLGEKVGIAAWRLLEQIPDPAARLLASWETINAYKYPQPKQKPFEQQLLYIREPVGVKEFIQSPEFLNKPNEVYPVVLAAAEELNSGQYVEAVLTGGIGSGKTTLALYTQAYQVYLLSCMHSPHKVYGLDPSSEILIIFQSITKNLATGVDYQRFRDMIDGSPYFRNHFPFDKNLASQMNFPNRVQVKPVAGNETAAIGQNVIGGLIDELNYMAVVEKSKASVDGGTYDQAVLVYDSIARRRKSRFLENGKMPGILCLVSSKKYPGQFTDQKMEEATRDKTIYVYDKRIWDIKPEAFKGKGWFRVFSGDMTRKPRIVGENETILKSEAPHVIDIPVDFLEDFKKDIINALREIAGVSTLARHPFFIETEKVSRAFREDIASVFSRPEVDFVETHVSLRKGAFFKPDLPRFVHCDLAISGDSAGLAVGCVYDFKDVSGTAGMATQMTMIHIDGVLRIVPPRNSEIMLYKVRAVILALRKMGLNLRWFTADQFQSSDSQQILRQQGLITGHQSVDIVPSPTGAGKKTIAQPYDYLKAALYDGRVRAPKHEFVLRELLMLEKDSKTGKIDHTPLGSKDCADCLAGVVFGLTMRRENWSQFGIPVSMIPSSIVDRKDKLKEGTDDGQTEYTEESRIEQLTMRS
jgi:hypothetical protein